MVQTYTIFGRKVGSHILSGATLGTFFGGIWLLRRGKKTTEEAGPPINAKSKEEENYVKDYIKKQTQEKAEQAQKQPQ